MYRPKLRVRAGDYVKDHEIAAYANPDHRECRGTGLLPSGVCDCARERFLDANLFNIWPDPERDALRWGPTQPLQMGGGLDDFVKDVKKEMREKDRAIFEAETGTKAFKSAWKNAKAAWSWNVRGKK